MCAIPDRCDPIFACFEVMAQAIAMCNVSAFAPVARL